jgi:hypothetical protein
MSRLLFIPVSGSHGSGEVQRCRLLAEALQAGWPNAEPHFLLAEGTPAMPWPTTTLPASPTRAVPDVVAAIERLRPAVVVFDGNTRVAALRAARRVGARVVLLSSRPSARDRGFRWRRMALLHEHWLVGADLLAPGGWRERLARWRQPGVVVRRFATLFAPPVDAGALLQRMGVSRPYAVLCPGGGRHLLDGESASQRFGAAATALACRGLAAVAVAAPAAAPAIDTGELPNADLMALLAQAEVALLGGGSLLVQALALGTPTVALPLQAEQAARVAWLERAGAVITATTAAPDALAEVLLQLQSDASTRARLRAQTAALGLANGLPAATEALAHLAGLAPEATPATPSGARA